MKAEDTFFQLAVKSHQLTTIQLNVIADDIHRATIRPRNEAFVTRRQKQIDFMWHLYGQGYMAKEIGALYGVTAGTIDELLRRRYKKLKS